MKIESKLITELKPATYNPRQISTKQYKDLKASIKKFGLVDPIIINKNKNVVIGGHQRLKICKELKYIEIDCVVLDLSKEEERELNIRLNKNTGDFDIDILANEFDIDELTDWGFKHIDLGINVDKIQEDLSDKLELQYKIEVEVISEKEQEQLYNELTKKGYKCRILTL
jgi:ParB-like chromosome segregation protein Spo0J